MNIHGNLQKSALVLLVLSVCSVLFVIDLFGDELLPLPDIKQFSNTQQTAPLKQEPFNPAMYRTYFEQFTLQVSQLDVQQLAQLGDGVFKLLDRATKQSEREFYWELLRIINTRESQLRNPSSTTGR